MQKTNLFATLCEKINHIQLILLLCGEASVGTEWAGESISPMYSRLYYIKSGSSYITVNNTPILLSPGKWYLLPADCSFYYACEKRMEHIFFHLKLCDLGGADLLRECPFPLSMKGNLEIDSLTKYVRSDNIANGLKLRHIIYDVLFSILEKYNIPIKSNEFSPCVIKAVQYIQQNLSMKLTISEIAEQVFVSPSTLTKNFKKELSLSVNHYIFDAVMSKASQLLLTGNLPILSISEELGFSDQFYFSRRFKEKFGKSPREYRKSIIV